MEGKKKIILITEDEPPMLNILTDRLSESGFETIQAKNGEEGLAMAIQHHPDLVLLDVLMPKLDGMTMMSRLRQDSWGKTVPIIMLTNVSADTDAMLQSVVDNQPAYYLVKSDTKLDEITDKIKEILYPTVKTGE